MAGTLIILASDVFNFAIAYVSAISMEIDILPNTLRPVRDAPIFRYRSSDSAYSSINMISPSVILIVGWRTTTSTGLLLVKCILETLRKRFVFWGEELLLTLNVPLLTIEIENN